MKLGWINLLGAIILSGLMAPNIIYAIKQKEKPVHPSTSGFVWLEQIGRYGCIVLMLFPRLWKPTGFFSAEAFAVWAIGMAVLLPGYWIAWKFHFHQPRFCLALALAILPCGIFILHALSLRSMVLLVFTILFAVGHIHVTVKSTCNL